MDLSLEKIDSPAAEGHSGITTRTSPQAERWIQAKPGRESDVENLLRSAQSLAQDESGTQTWFAWRMGSSTFGIFDTFEDENGRQAHLGGEIAKALLANAEALLAQPPDIQPIDLLAEKLPG